jgi:hypothetical protein
MFVVHIEMNVSLRVLSGIHKKGGKVKNEGQILYKVSYCHKRKSVPYVRASDRHGNKSKCYFLSLWKGEADI